MKNLLSIIFILSFLSGCNPDDDNNPPQNLANLPDWESVADLTGGGIVTGIQCMEIFNGDLYIGGGFSTVSGVIAKNIAKWNGTNWISLPGSKADQGYFIKSMKTYNGSLYVLFQNYNNLIQKWDGSSWSSITPSNTNYSIGSDMISFNGLLYLGANQVYNGTSLSNIVPSDSSPWLFSDTVCQDAYSYCVYNNELYCSGNFYLPNTNTIGMFKLVNNEWKDVAGITVSNPMADGMISYNNKMYSVGQFNGLSGLASNNFARWNSNSWESFLGIDQTYGGRVSPRMITYNNSLYLSPGFYGNIGYVEEDLCLGESHLNADTCFSNIIKYDGTNWEYLAKSDSARIYGPIIMYNSYMYAIGYFYDASPNHTIRIVRVQPQ